MMMRGVAASSSSSSSVASVVDVAAAAAAACVSPPSVALMGSSVFTRVFLVTGLPLSGTLSLLAVAGSIFFGI
jgi:hypothetical protein